MAELPLSLILPVCLLWRPLKRRLTTKELELSKLLDTIQSTISIPWLMGFFSPPQETFHLDYQHNFRFWREKGEFTQCSERFTYKHSRSLSFSWHCKYSFKSVCFVTPIFVFDFLQKKNDKGSIVLSVKHQTIEKCYWLILFSLSASW